MARMQFLEHTSLAAPDNLWVKNFIEIYPSHTVSELNVFLRFTQKFKMAVKNGGKAFQDKCVFAF